MLDLGNNRRIPTTSHVGRIPSFAAFVIPQLLGLPLSLGRSTSLSFTLRPRHSNSFSSSPTRFKAPKLNHRRELKPPWTTDQIRLLARLLPEVGPIHWTEISKTGGFDPPRSSDSLISAYERYIKGRYRGTSSLAEQEGRPLSGGPEDVFRVARKDIKRWTLEEEYILAKGVELHGAQHWDLIAADLPGRSPNDCSTRWRQYKEELAPWILSEWDDVRKGVRALETLMTTLMREAPEKQGQKTLTGVSLKPILDAAKADLAEKGEELPPQLLTTMMLRRFFVLVKSHTGVAKIHVRRYPEVSMHSPQVAAIVFVAEKSWREYKTGKLEKVKHSTVYAKAESKPDPSVMTGGSNPAQKAKEQSKKLKSR